VITDYLIKVKETSSLKNIDDSTTRKEELKDAFKVKDKRRYAGKSLLVFDDIYRSGETLTEITRVLYEEGKVKEVYVLVLTKTRTKR
jgi:predicted amidophosphoribosyltransferase